MQKICHCPYSSSEYVPTSICWRLRHGHPFRRTSLLRCGLQSKVVKITKISYFGDSRSFKVIDVDIFKSSSPVLVIIGSTPAPICNLFYARRANSDKISTFKGVLFITPSFEKTPLPWSMKFCDKKLEFLGHPTIKISWS